MTTLREWQPGHFCFWCQAPVVRTVERKGSGWDHFHPQDYYYPQHLAILDRDRLIRYRSLQARQGRPADGAA